MLLFKASITLACSRRRPRLKLLGPSVRPAVLKQQGKITINVQGDYILVFKVFVWPKPTAAQNGTFHTFLKA